MRLLLGQPFAFEVPHSVDECRAIMERDFNGKHPALKYAVKTTISTTREARRMTFDVETPPTRIIGQYGDVSERSSFARIQGGLTGVGDQTRVIGTVRMTWSPLLFMTALVVIWSPLCIAYGVANGAPALIVVGISGCGLFGWGIYEMDRAVRALYHELYETLMTPSENAVKSAMRSDQAPPLRESVQADPVAMSNKRG